MMDGRAAIERNGEALRRVLAALVVMAGLTGDRPMLPRHLRNAVLRLLRPAESAARRLVVALARSIAVTLPAQRLRKPDPAPATLRNGAGAGIVLPRGVRTQVAPGRENVRALPLCDAPKYPFRIRRTYVAPHRAPRISTPGFSERRPPPPPPSPHDQLDARRLKRRLGALAGVLDDLPRAALLFACWQARSRERSRRGGRLRWPLRPGHPPGFSARRGHEVHDILAHAHDLALWALDHPG